MNEFKSFFLECENKLKNVSLEEAKIEAELIFCHVLSLNKGKLKLQESISKKDKKQINKIIKKRLKHIPLQHILGTVEFLNLTLKVNKNVLIPRNETEFLADIIVNDINAKNKENFFVLDMCTGSGCLGLSIAKETKSFVSLADISKKALKVAKDNAKLNKIENVEFIRSNLFEKIGKRFDAFVSNPPYIKSEDISNLDKQVKEFEPCLALDGGKSGLDFYEKIINELPNYLKPNANVYFEVGFNQAHQVKEMLEKNFENIEIIKDYYNIERIVKANLK